MIIPTSMRETDHPLTPSHELTDSEPEPHPSTSDDLLKAVERIQNLWDIFQDAREMRADETMARAFDDLAGEYETLYHLVSGRTLADADILGLARDELSHADLLDKMQPRPNRTPRLHLSAPLGDNDHFVL